MAVRQACLRHAGSSGTLEIPWRGLSGRTQPPTDVAGAGERAAVTPESGTERVVVTPALAGPGPEGRDGPGHREPRCCALQPRARHHRPPISARFRRGRLRDSG